MFYFAIYDSNGMKKRPINASLLHICNGTCDNMVDTLPTTQNHIHQRDIIGILMVL